MRTEPNTGRSVVPRAAAVLAVLVSLLSYGSFTGGIAFLWSDHAERNHGFVWNVPVVGVTSGYAVVSDDVHLDPDGVQWLVDPVVDTVRVEVAASDPRVPVFVGAARSSDAARYLRGVAHRQVAELAQGGRAWGWLGPGVTTDRPGGPPGAAPGDVDFWLARSSGSGPQALTWPLAEGDWVLVVMRGDAHPGVSMTVRTGAAAPALRRIALGMVAVALALLPWAERLARTARHDPHRSQSDSAGPGAPPSPADERGTRATEGREPAPVVRR